MAQPLYLATCHIDARLDLDSVGEVRTKQVLINENQICTIEPAPNNTAIVKMANGDTFRTVDPSYEGWIGDFIVRKF